LPVRRLAVYGNLIGQQPTWSRDRPSWDLIEQVCLGLNYISIGTFKSRSLWFVTACIIGETTPRRWRHEGPPKFWYNTASQPRRSRLISSRLWKDSNLSSFSNSLFKEDC